jgi:hypothetical protein
MDFRIKSGMTRQGKNSHPNTHRLAPRAGELMLGSSHQAPPEKGVRWSEAEGRPFSSSPAFAGEGDRAKHGGGATFDLN